MKRVVDKHGTVHYAHPARFERSLCGEHTYDLVASQYHPFKYWQETHGQVTCEKCAKTVCAVRNEPYNTLVADVAREVLARAIYQAVEKETCDGEEVEEGQG